VSSRVIIWSLLKFVSWWLYQFPVLCWVHSANCSTRYVSRFGHPHRKYRKCCKLINPSVPTWHAEHNNVSFIHLIIRSDNNWTELFLFRNGMVEVFVSLRKSFLQLTQVVEMRNGLDTWIRVIMIKGKRIWWILRKCLQIEWRMIEEGRFRWMKVLGNPIGFVNTDYRITNSNNQCRICFHREWKSVL
jgi:hypothetical protein